MENQDTGGQRRQYRRATVRPSPDRHRRRWAAIEASGAGLLGGPPGNNHAATHGITAAHLIRPYYRDETGAQVTAEVEAALESVEDRDLYLLVEVPRQRARHAAEAIETIHRRLADYLASGPPAKRAENARAEAARRLRMWRRELDAQHEALRRGLLAAQQLGLAVDTREHVLQLAIPDGYTHVSVDDDLPGGEPAADGDPADAEASDGG